MGTAVLMPEIVITAEVTFALNAAPVTAGKLNESGVVSVTTTITLLIELLEELLSELTMELFIELLEELFSELMLELLTELLSKLLLELLIGLELAGTGLGFLSPLPPPPQAAKELARPRIKSLRIPV
jgi:hypothetical protein